MRSRARILAGVCQLYRSGPNQIALTAALRGALSVAGALLILQAMGYPEAALFAGLGALNTSIADAGGPYRTRLAAMGLCAALMPVSLWLGAQAHVVWWLAPVLILAIAIAGGLARVFGQTGASLGLIAGLVFLVGTHVPAAPAPAALNAVWYLAGAFWTILVALIFWRLRPYKRLELEVAACLQDVARLIVWVHAGADASDARTRRLARVIERQHRRLRESIERARETLGATRATVDGLSPTLTRLLALVRCASRVGVAGLAVADFIAAADRQGADRETVRDVASGLVVLEAACTSLAVRVATDRGEVRVEAVRTVLDLLRARSATRAGVDAGAASLRPVLRAFGLALRQLRSGEEAVQSLFGHEHRLRGRLMPPLMVMRPRFRLDTVRAHLTTRSIVFRHALRTGVIAAAGTVLFMVTDIPHGMWVPLTALIVLQPEFGGTLRRAFLRTAGTIAGGLVAGLLLLTLQVGWLLDVATVALAFGAFLMLRRSYGLAVMFLTPLVVLMLDRIHPATWDDVGFRLINTLVGAALALLGGFLLWPLWERRRLPDQLAAAACADREYLIAALEGLGRSGSLMDAVVDQRRHSEIEVGNAEAGFQRMLSEPSWRRMNVGRTLAVVTYLRRLSRHVTSLVAAADEAGARPSGLETLTVELARGLQALEVGIVRGVPVPASPGNQRSNDSVQVAVSVFGEPFIDAAGLDLQIEAVIADVNTLLDAAGLR